MVSNLLLTVVGRDQMIHSPCPCKRAVKDQISLHSPSIVLIEDKASGTSLIQELRSDGLSKVQAAPAIDGDKIMRLRAQTAKIEGGFVLLPKDAPWLSAYVLELISFRIQGMMIRSILPCLPLPGSDQTNQVMDGLGKG